MSFRRRKPRTGSCLLRIIFFGILIILLGFMLARCYQSSNAEIISPLPDGYKADTSILRFIKPKKDPDVLQDKIKQRIGNAWDNYSILVIDYNSPFVLGINESTIYAAASINKVPILAAIYDK